MTGGYDGPLSVVTMNARGAQGQGRAQVLAPLLEADSVVMPGLADILILVEAKGDEERAVRGEQLHRQLARGRASYWTHHVGVVIGPRLLDVEMHVTTRHGGRAVYLDFEWGGEPVHVVALYGPAEDKLCPDSGADAPQDGAEEAEEAPGECAGATDKPVRARDRFYGELWLPTGGTLVVAGDFNTVGDRDKDIKSNGSKHNPGGDMWNSKAEAAGLHDTKHLAGVEGPCFTWEGTRAWGTPGNYARRLDRVHVTPDLHVAEWYTHEPWAAGLDHAAVAVVLERGVPCAGEAVQMLRMRPDVLSPDNTDFLKGGEAMVANSLARIAVGLPDELVLEECDSVVQRVSALYRTKADAWRKAKRRDVKSARKAYSEACERAKLLGEGVSHEVAAAAARDSGAVGRTSPWAVATSVHDDTGPCASPPGTPPTEPNASRVPAKAARGAAARQRRDVHVLLLQAIERVQQSETDTEDAYAVDHDTFGDVEFYGRHLRGHAATCIKEQYPATFADDEQRVSPGLAQVEDGGCGVPQDLEDWTEAGPRPAGVTPEPDGLIRDSDDIRANTGLNYVWHFRKRRDHRPSQARLLQAAGEARGFTREMVQMLGAEMTEPEMKRGVARLRGGRAPGPDGVTGEAIQGMPSWPALLCAVANAAYRLGRLPECMRQGTIVLLLKKGGDKARCKSLRPLTMLCRLLVVVANVLTERLERVLEHVIQQDQTAFVPGRQMSENLIKIIDALQVARDQEVPLAMLSVDMRAAYDAVSHETLYGLLNVYCRHGANGTTAGEGGLPSGAGAAQEGCEARFTCWVRMLTAGAVRRVMVNGKLTVSFELGAGLPQGSPLSPALFTLFVDVLGVMLYKHLRGMRLPPTWREDADGSRTAVQGSRHKLVAVRFADDVNLVLRKQEISLALDVIQCWSVGCSMALCAAKSIGMWIGSLRDKGEPWRSAGKETPGHSTWRDGTGGSGKGEVRCTWARPGESVRVLGVQVGYNVDVTALWREVGVKMLTQLRMWGRVKGLGLRARVMVLKTMYFSRCWFLAAYCEHHGPTVALLRKAALVFLHRGFLPAGVTVMTPAGSLRVPTALNFPHVATAVRAGGLAMWCPLQQITVLHAKWIWLLLQPVPEVRDDVASWTHLPRHIITEVVGRERRCGHGLGVLVDGPATCLGKALQGALPPLWRRAVKAWASVRQLATLEVPTEPEHVASCPLWCSTLVVGRGGPLSAPNGWVQAGVCTVRDVWNEEAGRYASLAEMQRRVPSRLRRCITATTLHEVVAAIPTEWAPLLRTAPRPHEGGDWLGVSAGPESEHGHGEVADLYLVLEPEHGPMQYQRYFKCGDLGTWVAGGAYLAPQVSQARPSATWNVPGEGLARVLVTTKEERSLATDLRVVRPVTLVGWEHAEWAASGRRLCWGPHDKPACFTVKGVRERMTLPPPGLPEPAAKTAIALDMVAALGAAYVTRQHQTRGTVWERVVLATWDATWPPSVRDQAWRLLSGAAYFRGQRRHWEEDTAVCKVCVLRGDKCYERARHAYVECPAYRPLWRWGTALLRRLGHEPRGAAAFMVYGALRATAQRPVAFAHDAGHAVRAVRGAMAAGFMTYRSVLNLPPPQGEPGDELPPTPPPPPHPVLAVNAARRVLRRMIELDHQAAVCTLRKRRAGKWRPDGPDGERREAHKAKGAWSEGPAEFNVRWLLLARVERGPTTRRGPPLTFVANELRLKGDRDWSCGGEGVT